MVEPAGRPDAAVGAERVPELAFVVEEAGVLEFAAVPTLRFGLRIDAPAGADIRAVALAVQLRIAAAERAYDAGERARLVELFGAPGQTGAPPPSLVWAHAAVQVPRFTGSIRVELPVPCTYDFDVVATKYLHALGDGAAPLELLFSGSTFYAGPGGALQVGRIGWDREARFRMPIAVWREAMDHYFPDSAWLRLRRDAFDRLVAFKARRALPTWEAALAALLDAGGAAGA